MGGAPSRPALRLGGAVCCVGGWTLGAADLVSDGDADADAGKELEWAGALLLATHAQSGACVALREYDHAVWHSTLR